MSDHTPDDDRWKLLDPATRVNLDDVGLPGHELAESIDADGHRDYWLILTAGMLFVLKFGYTPVPPMVMKLEKWRPKL